MPNIGATEQPLHKPLTRREIMTGFSLVLSARDMGLPAPSERILDSIPYLYLCFYLLEAKYTPKV